MWTQLNQKNYISNSPVFVLDKPSNPEENLGDLHVPSFNIFCGCTFWNTHLMATINHKSLTDSKSKLRSGLCMWVTWTQENVSMGDSHICYDKNGNNRSYTFFTLVGEYKCGVLEKSSIKIEQMIYQKKKKHMTWCNKYSLSIKAK